MLRDLCLKAVYKTEFDNILEDFYVPALSHAKSYDRAVGFFSSSAINHAAQGLSAFALRGGKIRLILGAFVDEEDLETVKEGYKQREILKSIGEEFIRHLESVSDELFQSRLQMLGWLVAHDVLNIKVAFRQRGMFHEKIGIITDENGDSLVFTGSANESAYALLPNYNYESINVFKSWIPAFKEHCTPHIESFELLWQNRSPNTLVFDAPAAIKERLLTVAQSISEAPTPMIEIDLWNRYIERRAKREAIGMPRTPTTLGGMPFSLRPHQSAALNAWRAAGSYQGVLALATGAGKTITAIHAIVRLSEKIDGLAVVIAVPYQNLADQWCDVLREFNINPIRCYQSKALWKDSLELAAHELSIGVRKFMAAVVVNRTLGTADFRSCLGKLNGKRLFWIGDECHHHGGEGLYQSLPDHAEFRLGLSATPEHYLDHDRNRRIEDFYGKIVFEYSLTQAIKDGCLTPYDYHVVLIELTETEADEYVELSERIGKAFASADFAKVKDDEILQSLLRRRARLIGSARNKLGALQDLVGARTPTKHTLVYCGDGRVETDQERESEAGYTENEKRQIEEICALMARSGWDVSRFTSHESKKIRERILENFKLGVIDVMVAIRCLDEGIDIPACGTAYILASSRNPRQFVQRRGRILRKAPGKESAVIYDFIVTLNNTRGEENEYAERLVRSELERVAEFASLARNRHDVFRTLRPLLNKYDLEHLV